ncbi:hypothetical protein QZH41_011334 [Actinostola sp. cb2023]|nr:hypothetical protein QZH41_011334 [Actinostola sp. cb2023]
MLCQCSAIARSRGYRYIGIQYFAECWGGGDERYSLEGKSTNCMQSYATFGKEVCNFALQSGCVGLGSTNFVYYLPDCWEMVDVAVLLDLSSSMQGKALTAAKHFLKSLVDLLKISRPRTHMGLITFYSKTAKTEFDFSSPLNNRANAEELKAVIDGFQSPGGSTWPDVAFERAVTLFTEEKGARGESPKIVITITDGTIHQDSTIYPIMLKLKSKGVELLSVGVGSDVDQREVNALAFNNLHNVFDGNKGDGAKNVADRITVIAKDKCNGGRN